MFPSVGSISIPADVPHFRPSGSLPQFAVTFGAGFGRPSPVIGFPITVTGAVAGAVADSGEHPMMRPSMLASNVGVRIRSEDMAVSLWRSRCNVLPARSRLTGPIPIDGQRRIRGDLQRRAMVIAVVAIRVQRVLAHPLDDLQRAFLAIDVGQANVGLME